MSTSEKYALLSSGDDSLEEDEFIEEIGPRKLSTWSYLSFAFLSGVCVVSVLANIMAILYLEAGTFKASSCFSPLGKLSFELIITCLS